MLPYEDRYSIRVREPKKIATGFDSIPHYARGVSVSWTRNNLKPLRNRAVKILDESAGVSELADRSLKSEIGHALDAYRRNNLLPGEEEDRVLALFCEAAARTLSMRPYPEQLIGALVIRQGGVAEMATGEGKSLTAALGAALLAAAGLPVHVVTANDYLAERDAELMASFYRYLSLDVGSVGADQSPEERRRIYQHAIVYTTAKELLGDYLRDRLRAGERCDDLQRAVRFALRTGDQGDVMTQRGLYAAVIDEADNVLVDEAVTPLILSAERKNDYINDAVAAAQSLLNSFTVGEHYRVILRTREIRWTARGDKRLRDVADGLPKIWRGTRRSRELFTFILQAHELFHRGEHYVVEDDKIVLVDILTGRLTPNRNLGIGLQQAVEMKEGVPPSPPTETIARFSFQRFFRLFPHLCGMSGTVREAGRELWKVYEVPVVSVPCHRPVIRTELPRRYFRTREGKFAGIIEKISAVHHSGQPVLVGTRTIEVSEKIAAMCEERGITTSLLNAVHHREEAEIVAGAGSKGAVTIATNMAGRGTDIKLGRGVKELGGLLVIIVEPQTSGRLDRQLLGRSGRQGDPGCGQIYTSAEDILVRGFAPRPLKPFLGDIFRFGGAPLGFMLKPLVSLFQGRSENTAAKRRMAILKSDNWIDENLSFTGKSS